MRLMPTMRRTGGKKKRITAMMRVTSRMMRVRLEGELMRDHLRPS